MVPKKVINYLDKNNISYEIVEHRTVFTAYDLAMTLHLKPEQIAKNLLLKAGSDFILAVLPGNRNLDLKKLAKLANISKVSLPKESVMKSKFKVKPGALPGFGGLYKLSVFVDKNLLKNKKILISSGSFTESIVMPAKSFIKMEEAIVGIFSIVKKIKKQKPAKKKKTKPAKPKTKKKRK